MTHFEIYTFILCFIVFVLLTGLSTFCIVTIFKLQSKLIKVGAVDGKIILDYEKLKLKKQSKFGKVIDYALTIFVVAIFVFAFSGSLYMSCTQNTYFDNVPTYRVVKTTSMAKKNKENEYLFKNDLNEQIQAFDLILTYKLPKEEDLKLYDIVVYEVDDILVVHRIVKIEEPNGEHPKERWFLLQGDAIESPDRFPVRYEQMKGIYRGEKVPFIGSFVLFMQSPAGWLCMVLVAFTVITSPIVDNKLLKIKKERLVAVGYFEVASEDVLNENSESDNESIAKPIIENDALNQEEIESIEQTINSKIEVPIKSFREEVKETEREIVSVSELSKQEGERSNEK